MLINMREETGWMIDFQEEIDLQEASRRRVNLHKKSGWLVDLEEKSEWMIEL